MTELTLPQKPAEKDLSQGFIRIYQQLEKKQRTFTSVSVILLSLKAGRQPDRGRERIYFNTL